MGQYPADGLQQSDLPRPPVAVGHAARRALADRPGELRARDEVSRRPESARHADRQQLARPLSVSVALLLEDGAGSRGPALPRPGRTARAQGRSGDRHGGNRQSGSADAGDETGVRRPRRAGLQRPPYVPRGRHEAPRRAARRLSRRRCRDDREGCREADQSPQGARCGTAAPLLRSDSGFIRRRLAERVPAPNRIIC